MATSVNTSNKSKFLHSAFENMRKKLLDAGGYRSKLLNLDLARKTSIRIVDELPNQLGEILLSEKSMTLVPVPEPSEDLLIENGYIEWNEEDQKFNQLKNLPNAREWAGVLGIHNAYELPTDSSHADDGRHDDLDLQTLLFEPELNKILKRISTESKTAIEETGNNILFLSLGFLEWYDQKNTGKGRLAPLFMIPVKIEKDTKNRLPIYKINYTGEDIIPNLTLREKLAVDFGIQLPDVQSESGAIHTPEAYFRELKSIIMRASVKDKMYSDWKVHRYASVATLSLGKLLMYLDLDPARWPDGEENIIEHEIIKSFFEDSISDEGGEQVSDNVYVLDEVEDLNIQFPMVEDADSSQMSVLIDVLSDEGSNMVVEGPPGTGKSQTITNLIAGAISQGKKVLFVAEKQAALDVVKRRMDKAGLGEFCLDLHSDKARKRAVLDSIDSRIQKEDEFAYSDRDFARQLAKYEVAREELQEYAQLVNTVWKKTELTIHEILSAATKYRNRVEPLDFISVEPEGLDTDNFSINSLDEKLASLELFHNYLSIVSKQLGSEGDWSQHPWFGVENKRLVSEGVVKTVSLLVDWNEEYKSFIENLEAKSEFYAIRKEEYSTVDKIEQLISDWGRMPAIRGSEYLPAIERIDEQGQDDVELALKLHIDIGSFYKSLEKTFIKSYLIDLSKLERVEGSVGCVVDLGVKAGVTLKELYLASEKIKKLTELFFQIHEIQSALTSRLSPEIKNLLDSTRNGLEELKKFASLANELPQKLVSKRDVIFDNDVLDDALESLKSEIASIQAEKEKLSKDIDLDKVPSDQEVVFIRDQIEKKNIFSFLSADWRDAKRKIAYFYRGDTANIAAVDENLVMLKALNSKIQSLRKNSEYIDLLGIHFRGEETDVKNIGLIRDWYKKIRREYGIGFGRRVALATALMTIDDEVFKGILSSRDILMSGVGSFLGLLGALAEEFSKVEIFHAENLHFDADPSPLRCAYTESTAAIRTIQESLKDPDQPLLDVVKALKTKKDLLEESEKLESLQIPERYFDKTVQLSAAYDGLSVSHVSTIRHTLNFYKEVADYSSGSRLKEIILKEKSGERLAEIQKAGRDLKEAWSQVQAREKEYLVTIDAKREQWLKSVSGDSQRVVDRNQRAIDNPEWLDSWLKYLFARGRMEKGGFENINRYLISHDTDLDTARNIMKFSVYTRIALEIYSSVDGVAEKSGHEQTALQHQFAEIDQKLKQLQRERVAAKAASIPVPRGKSGAKVSSYTEANLIKREIEKKTRHIAIRSLVDRAGRALQAYKPCFMMSPMAVAKYLPPGAVKFDLVIMDEASQVKPEFALSSFARGEKSVVVGDPKQLPPTSFFDKVGYDDFADSADSAVIQESESILDAVSGRFPGRSLKWHYRSQHESLIAFSNYKFYDSKLIVFPSPWNNSANYGINFNYVENGRYLSSVNKVESQIIIEGLKRQLTLRPDESVGIVAMNSKQRDQIESDLELSLASDMVFKEAYLASQASDDPVFIKNLENVQGDERDVIFISFTYGPQEGGVKSIPQRFGPINGADGWRRLNVLFTRAKKRVEVFSSMVADQILVTENSSRGVNALKGYLEYAQSGRLIGTTATSEGEPDSDFEIAVMEALSHHGFECVAQVGVAGFYIDIAVKDPGMPGRYLMGIECDGATYHSSKSTRDRDRVRQAVLEGLDWRIRRIWSTDWFMNPAAELRIIVDELKELSTPLQEVEPESQAVVAIDPKQSTPELNVNEYINRASQSLGERLLDFAVNVIEKEMPETPPERRLLRPDMLQRFKIERPVNHDDFTVLIPKYLREHTDPMEAQMYLDEVLELISEFESMGDSLVDN